MRDRSCLRRLIRWAYGKYVDEVWIPLGTEACVHRWHSRSPLAGEVSYVKLSRPGISRNGRWFNCTEGYVHRVKEQKKK